MERDARKYSRTIGLRFLSSLSAALLVCLFSLPVQAQTTFVSDTFTGSSGTLLENHNPDTGDSSSWSCITSSRESLVINGSNELIMSKKLNDLRYKNTTAPGSADYVVSAKAKFVTADSNNLFYLMGRISSDNQNLYQVVINSGASGNNVTIQKVVGVTNATTIGGPCTASISPGMYYRFTFAIQGSSLKIAMNGTEISGCTTTDSSFTDAGNAGIGINAKTDATYVVADDFFASTFAATAVNLSSFSATQHKNGVVLKWRTGFEVDNLGFHVYREEGGEKHRITKEMIKGSALKTGPGHITAGYSYTWWDTASSAALLKSRQGRDAPQAQRSIRYWLEDVDLNGQRTLHGPVDVEITDKPVEEKEESALLSQLAADQSDRDKIVSRVLNLQARLKNANPKAIDPPLVASEPVEEKLQAEAKAEAKAEVKSEDTEKVKVEPKAEVKVEGKSKAQVKAKGKVKAKTQRMNATPAEVQWVLAGRPAIKIFVQEEGWYRVSQPDLVAAGLDPKVNPRFLRLFSDGVEQPIVVTGKRPNQFDPGDAIEFYGTGLDTPSIDARVYWLVAGTRPGKRVEKIYSGGINTRSFPASFPFTVESKPRSIYFAALKNGEEKGNFFGPLVSAAPVEQTLNVRNADPTPPQDDTLEVTLQGVTLAPHSVQVLLNDTEVGSMAFQDRENKTARFPIFPSLLKEGENIVKLVALGGEMDISLLDSIRLTYGHAYRADEDYLGFTAPGGSYLVVDGFSNSVVRVMDVTDGEPVQEVPGKMKWYGDGYSIRIRVPPYQGKRRLLAFTEDRVGQPPAVAANEPTEWHKADQGADLVMITHGQFLESLRPLKALREAQGLSVALVDIEDLYDEFSYGEKTPEAIKDFLFQAKTFWSKPPRFVLLVGDASFDPLNYLGFGNFDFVPTKLVETAYLETASDDWFADFSGDGVPQMAVGRLPVRTVEEASLVVAKIVGYEQSARGPSEALLVADMQDEEFDFEASAAELVPLFPENIKVWGLSRGRFNDDLQVHSELLRNLNAGNLLVNYLGHGSVDVWRGGIFSGKDAEGLSNKGNLGFFVNMTCLNGFFQDVYTTSLAEELLKAPGGGAVAVWASSGLTEPDKQLLMNKALIRLLFNGEGLTIGEAAMRAKAATGDQDIRRTWVLFGDPSTRLKP
jgi:hypothetical protein